MQMHMERADEDDDGNGERLRRIGGTGSAVVGVCAPLEMMEDAANPSAKW